MQVSNIIIAIKKRNKKEEQSRRLLLILSVFVIANAVPDLPIVFLNATGLQVLVVSPSMPFRFLVSNITRAK